MRTYGTVCTCIYSFGKGVWTLWNPLLLAWPRRRRILGVQLLNIKHRAFKPICPPVEDISHRKEWGVNNNNSKVHYSTVKISRFEFNELLAMTDCTTLVLMRESPFLYVRTLWTVERDCRLFYNLCASTSRIPSWFNLGKMYELLLFKLVSPLKHLAVFI